MCRREDGALSRVAALSASAAEASFEISVDVLRLFAVQVAAKVCVGERRAGAGREPRCFDPKREITG